MLRPDLDVQARKAEATSATALIAVRRAAALTSYWVDGGLVVHNYLTGIRVPAPPVVLEVLEFCGEWRTLNAIAARFASYGGAPLKRLVGLLVRYTLLDRRLSGRAVADALPGWDAWSPSAAFFHFSTKDMTYEPVRVTDRRLVRKAKLSPPPPPVKSYAGARRVLLALPGTASSLAGVLRARRSWRRFGGERVRLDDIATLLGLTWGVQGWAENEYERCAFKTSPSGGARHPIEAYVLASRVDGLPAGLYHYDPDAHELSRLKRGLSPARLEQYLGGQAFAREAAAVVVMTAVFARSQWRYDAPRAYRVVLLDAGHLGQTFCLVATELGLAPFCTAALADSLIERDLGLDGVSESVMYACGVGTRPPGIEWAPVPGRARPPQLIPPKSAVRKAKR